MYECFHCGHRAVIWDSDFSFEDYGEEGEGIIHVCHCSNCGAEIEYRIPITEEDVEELEEMEDDPNKNDSCG
jgi:transcription elongation factor Elf1